MAVIALKGTSFDYAMGMGVFDGLSMAFSDAKRTTSTLHDALSTLKSKIDVAATAASVDTSQTQAQQAQARESTKKSSLTLAYEKLDELISDTGRVDQRASSKISSREDDFYKRYYYLKPECKKSKKEKRHDKWAERWQNFKDFWGGVGNAIANIAKNVVDFCKEHWKEILATVVIVVGAVLAIAAVIATGGVALVPLLTGLITGAGSLFGATIAVSTAMTIATVISMTVAVVAVGSTLASSTLNIIDVWCDTSDNPTFKKWQKGLNITAAISNGLYSIGNLYNSVKGVSGKEFIARNKAIENGKMGYSNLDAKHPNMKHQSGADYDQTRKTEILNENRARNNGQLRSDKTGKLLEQPQKSARGVKPPSNEAQVDHIVPRSNGGANSFENAQVIERSSNIAKSNKPFFSESDYFKYSIPDKPNVGGSIFSTITGSTSGGIGIWGSTQGD